MTLTIEPHLKEEFHKAFFRFLTTFVFSLHPQAFDVTVENGQMVGISIPSAFSGEGRVVFHNPSTAENLSEMQATTMSYILHNHHNTVSGPADITVFEIREAIRSLLSTIGASVYYYARDRDAAEPEFFENIETGEKIYSELLGTVWFAKVREGGGSRVVWSYNSASREFCFLFERP